MKDNRKTGAALVAALVLLCLSVPPVDAAQLLYIRVGEYESLTRIVFEFSGTVKFKGPELKGSRQVAVDFMDTTTANPALQKMRDRSGHIEKIEFVQGKSLLTANVELTSSSFNIKTFYLFTPDRLVLDLYWTGAPVAAVTAVPPVPEKAPEAVSAQPVPENVTQPPTEPAAAKPPGGEAPPSKEAASPVPQASVDSDQLQSYLFMGLIGLSIAAIMIALLVTMVFLKKRRLAVSSKNRMASERTAGGVDESLEDENISALDSKIRDELNKYGK
jgi:hypothetical protein